ncbi:MAG: class I SAM-dependent methyltransferase [Planctomycetota bacterium]
MTLDAARYYEDLAAAYARGALALGLEAGDDEALRQAAVAGLRLFRFKRSELPRVRRVLGLLRGLWPAELLDAGSGRGTFLWPLLAGLPALRVTSVERCPRRAGQLAAVARGLAGARLRALRGDLSRLPLSDGAFDGATALEVLEHLPDPGAAARELVRVVRRFVIASVPSKPDDNPEHLRVFSPADLRDLFLRAGARRVEVEHVLNHRIAVAQR